MLHPEVFPLLLGPGLREGLRAAGDDGLGPMPSVFLGAVAALPAYGVEGHGGVAYRHHQPASRRPAAGLAHRGRKAPFQPAVGVARHRFHVLDEGVFIRRELLDHRAAHIPGLFSAGHLAEAVQILPRFGFPKHAPGVFPRLVRVRHPEVLAGVGKEIELHRDVITAVPRHILHAVDDDHAQVALRLVVDAARRVPRHHLPHLALPHCQQGQVIGLADLVQSLQVNRADLDLAASRLKILHPAMHPHANVDGRP